METDSRKYEKNNHVLCWISNALLWLHLPQQNASLHVNIMQLPNFFSLATRNHLNFTRQSLFKIKKNYMLIIIALTSVNSVLGKKLHVNWLASNSKGSN